ncbi:uncharacterized protein LOC135846977 [Planococcus citri]|uniref:uncharacterized protein LOC135846977 n=1 Tax=Planococcus citri TaxID=170843 RepID=UPI0031F81ABD
MKLLNFVLILMVCFTLTFSRNQIRSKRTIDKLLGYSNCWQKQCPPWKCQDDSAVIHGYCCHCPGSEYDNVPVPCYPDLKCPISPEPLCSDYNFMMDCCCTGP